MKGTVSSMAERYNNWKKNPARIRVASSVQTVLKGNKAQNSASSCTGGCGAECGSASCVSCKTD